MSDECPDEYWRAGKTREYKTIWMWRSACRVYGWAMLTSVVIHEYGHHLLYDAKDDSKGLEAERKANEYGFNAMPDHLVPELYWQYREFFLRSYIDKEASGKDWDEEECLRRYDEWLATTLPSSPSPSVAP
jgi:hypothetical protein